MLMMPPLICVMPLPCTVVIAPFSSAVPEPSILIIVPLMVMPLGEIAILFEPTFSSMDCVDSITQVLSVLILPLPPVAVRE